MYVCLYSGFHYGWHKNSIRKNYFIIQFRITIITIYKNFTIIQIWAWIYAHSINTFLSHNTMRITLNSLNIYEAIFNFHLGGCFLSFFQNDLLLLFTLILREFKKASMFLKFKMTIPVLFILMYPLFLFAKSGTLTSFSLYLLETSHQVQPVLKGRGIKFHLLKWELTSNCGYTFKTTIMT